jgi:hypothetical protein
MGNKYLYSSFVFILLFLSLHFHAVGQVVQTVPAFPTESQEVTLLFDVKLAKDSRAKGLLGKTDDVYLWSGAGVVGSTNAFQYQPAGQTNFNQPFAPGKMTYLGNDKWEIKLVPKQYFGVLDDKTINQTEQPRPKTFLSPSIPTPCRSPSSSLPGKTSLSMPMPLYLSRPPLPAKRT